MARPAVRYATTADGLEIAYQVLGDGPIDIVIVPGLMSNVDRNADYPLYGGYLRRFPRFARTIVLDRRGAGPAHEAGAAGCSTTGGGGWGALAPGGDASQAGAWSSHSGLAASGAATGATGAGATGTGATGVAGGCSKGVASWIHSWPFQRCMPSGVNRGCQFWPSHQ